MQYVQGLYMARTKARAHLSSVTTSIAAVRATRPSISPGIRFSREQFKFLQSGLSAGGSLNSTNEREGFESDDPPKGDGEGDSSALLRGMPVHDCSGSLGSGARLRPAVGRVVRPNELVSGALAQRGT